MRISLIAAVSENGVIGRDGALPWHLPADLEYFKARTLGKPVVMGRATWDSIGQQPLADRLNVVLTHDDDLRIEGALRASSVDDALLATEGAREVMVIGGASVYEAFLPRVQRAYLTLVRGEFEGDRYFPRFSLQGWREIERREHCADDVNPHAYAFVILDRDASVAAS